MRQCVICKSSTNDFEKHQQRCVKCNHLRKCNTCNEIKDVCMFRKDKSRPQGIGHRCKSCENDRVKQKPSYRNSQTMKIRSFFRECIKRSTRGRSSSMWEKLGYTKNDFLDKFPIIPEGYHVDHCVPLSWFKQEAPLSISCSLDNLQLLSAVDNLEKSNKFAHYPTSYESFEKIIKYIKPEYEKKLLTCRPPAGG